MGVVITRNTYLKRQEILYVLDNKLVSKDTPNAIKMTKRAFQIRNQKVWALGNKIEKNQRRQVNYKKCT